MKRKSPYRPNFLVRRADGCPPYFDKPSCLKREETASPKCRKLIKSTDVSNRPMSRSPRSPPYREYYDESREVKNYVTPDTEKLSPRPKSYSSTSSASDSPLCECFCDFCQVQTPRDSTAMKKPARLKRSGPEYSRPDEYLESYQSEDKTPISSDPFSKPKSRESRDSAPDPPCCKCCCESTRAYIEKTEKPRRPNALSYSPDEILESRQAEHMNPIPSDFIDSPKSYNSWSPAPDPPFCKCCCVSPQGKDEEYLESVQREDVEPSLLYPSPWSRPRTLESSAPVAPYREYYADSRQEENDVATRQENPSPNKPNSQSSRGPASSPAYREYYDGSRQEENYVATRQEDPSPNRPKSQSSRGLYQVQDVATQQRVRSDKLFYSPDKNFEPGQADDRTPVSSSPSHKSGTSRYLDLDTPYCECFCEARQAESIALRPQDLSDVPKYQNPRRLGPLTEDLPQMPRSKRLPNSAPPPYSPEDYLVSQPVESVIPLSQNFSFMTMLEGSRRPAGSPVRFGEPHNSDTAKLQNSMNSAQSPFRECFCESHQAEHYPRNFVHVSKLQNSSGSRPVSPYPDEYFEARQARDILTIPSDASNPDPVDRKSQPVTSRPQTFRKPDSRNSSPNEHLESRQKKDKTSIFSDPLSKPKLDEAQNCAPDPPFRESSRAKEDEYFKSVQAEDMERSFLYPSTWSRLRTSESLAPGAPSRGSGSSPEYREYYADSRQEENDVATRQEDSSANRPNSQSSRGPDSSPAYRESNEVSRHEENDVATRPEDPSPNSQSSRGPASSPASSPAHREYYDDSRQENEMATLPNELFDRPISHSRRSPAIRECFCNLCPVEGAPPVPNSSYNMEKPHQPKRSNALPHSPDDYSQSSQTQNLTSNQLDHMAKPNSSESPGAGAPFCECCRQLRQARRVMPRSQDLYRILNLYCTRSAGVPPYTPEESCYVETVLRLLLDRAEARKRAERNSESSEPAACCCACHSNAHQIKESTSYSELPPRYSDRQLLPAKSKSLCFLSRSAEKKKLKVQRPCIIQRSDIVVRPRSQDPGRTLKPRRSSRICSLFQRPHEFFESRRVEKVCRVTQDFNTTPMLRSSKSLSSRQPYNFSKDCLESRYADGVRPRPQDLGDMTKLDASNRAHSHSQRSVECVEKRSTGGMTPLAQDLTDIEESHSSQSTKPVYYKLTSANPLARHPELQRAIREIPQNGQDVFFVGLHSTDDLNLRHVESMAAIPQYRAKEITRRSNSVLQMPSFRPTLLQQPQLQSSFQQQEPSLQRSFRCKKPGKPIRYPTNWRNKNNQFIRCSFLCANGKTFSLLGPDRASDPLGAKVLNAGWGIMGNSSTDVCSGKNIKMRNKKVDSF